MLSGTCSTPKPDPKSDFPPKSPRPQSPGKAESSSRAQIDSGMKPREAALVGYLMARAAMRRPIDNTPDIKWEIDRSAPRQPGGKAKLTGKNIKRTDGLNHLRAGHETVQEVSDLMPLGRANVREDLEKAKSACSFQRHKVSRRLRGPLEVMHGYRPGTMFGNDFAQLTAAISQYAQTGVCGSYATNTTAWHGAKLAGMKDERAIVAQARDANVDHVWSEMIPQGKGGDGKPILHGDDVIMDGWCKENLAVLREDSTFAALDEHGRGRHLSHDHILDPRSGPEALAKVNQFKARIEESRDLQNMFHSDLMRVVAAGTKPPEDNLWDATTVFHEDFREQAAAALHNDAMHPEPGKYGHIPGPDPVWNRAKHASLVEIQAVGVARSLGANIRGAKPEAPVIIASAREMFPRPEPESESILARLSALFTR